MNNRNEHTWQTNREPPARLLTEGEIEILTVIRPLITEAEYESRVMLRRKINSILEVVFPHRFIPREIVEVHLDLIGEPSRK